MAGLILDISWSNITHFEFPIEVAYFCCMAGVDIRTAQNVVIEYETASLRQRGLAIFIDILIILAVYLFAWIAGIAWMTSISDSINNDSLELILVLFSPVTGFLLYQFLFELLTNGQTPGQKILGIQVIRLDGKEPEAFDFLLRAVFHILETLMSVGILAAVLIASSPGKQRLGDLAANTTVIRKRSERTWSMRDILRIETLDVYTPKHPEVRHLSEADMLLVKTILTRYQRFRNDAHRKALEMTAARLATVLEISEPPGDKVAFLKTLLKDYIVLTR